MERQPSIGARFGELVGLDGKVILEIEIGGAGDEAAHEAEALVGIQRFSRARDQRVLADAGRANDENQHSGRTFAQLTLFPSFQTARTPGTRPEPETRTRSALLPMAISPRSLRPAALAGFSVTVARA
ncbi:hypothetical protein D9M68_932170 [compost metagenome]